MILAEGGAEQCAAFFAEPVMGAGGVIVPPRTYFEKIKAVLDRYDMLLVADEVICGFGRTGNMWGAETFGMQPDFMTVAKALSSAYLPISGVMTTQAVYEVLADNSRKRGFFGHGFTYSAHPVSAAVALETLAIYGERDVLGHVRQVAPVFQRELRRFADHPLVGEARGVGLMGALDMVADKTKRTAFDPSLKVGPRIARAAREHGIITRAMGDTMGFSPPLVISEAEIVEMFARFGRALDEVAGSVLPGQRAAPESEAACAGRWAEDRAWTQVHAPSTVGSDEIAPKPAQARAALEIGDQQRERIGHDEVDCTGDQVYRHRHVIFAGDVCRVHHQLRGGDQRRH